MTVICPVCETENDAGNIVCQECGETLMRNQDFAFETHRSTKPLSLSSREDVRPHMAPIPPDAMVVMQVAGSTISFPADHNVVVGRKAPDSQGRLADLNPFNGFELGVSRNHAQIQLDANGYLELTDLGSSNGTFLNGVRLEPLRPYRLVNGDEVRFARLATYIYVELPEGG